MANDKQEDHLRILIRHTSVGVLLFCSKTKKSIDASLFLSTNKDDLPLALDKVTHTYKGSNDRGGRPQDMRSTRIQLKGIYLSKKN
jgi:hypothetical protein